MSVYFCSTDQHLHILARERFRGWRHTFFSLSLSAFHSCPHSLAASPTEMPLKSPLAQRFDVNCAKAPVGRLTARSSLISLPHFVRPALLPLSFRRRDLRALFAVAISSAVWDSTHCLYSAACFSFAVCARWL